MHPERGRHAPARRRPRGRTPSTPPAGSACSSPPPTRCRRRPERHDAERRQPATPMTRPRPRSARGSGHAPPLPWRCRAWRRRRRDRGAEIIVAPSELGSSSARQASSSAHSSCIDSAVLRALRHRPLDCHAQARRAVRPKLEHARRRLVDVPERDRDEVLALERDASGQELVENDAERIDIGEGVDPLAAGLLGRDVPRSYRARCR